MIARVEPGCLTLAQRPDDIITIMKLVMFSVQSVRANIQSKSACVKGESTEITRSFAFLKDGFRNVLADLVLNHITNGTLCSSDLADRLVQSLGGEIMRVHAKVAKVPGG